MKQTVRNVARNALIGLGARSALLGLGKRIFPARDPYVFQTRIRDLKLLTLVNEDVGRRIVFLRRYETRDTDFLLSRMRSDDICFDIGANTGYYTMLMAGLAAHGEVHAFEPLRLNWHLLCTGMILNNFNHVIANQCAVGDREGEIAFSEAEDGAYSSMIPVERKPEARKITVPLRTLDGYMAAHGLARVDVIKMDIEGAELLALRGAAALLARALGRPRVVMIELFQQNLSTYDTSIDEVILFMRGLDYMPYVVKADGRVVECEPDHYNVFQNIFFLDRRNTDAAPS